MNESYSERSVENHDAHDDSNAGALKYSLKIFYLCFLTQATLQLELKASRFLDEHVYFVIRALCQLTSQVPRFNF